MNATARSNLGVMLNQLRDHRRATAADRRNLRRVLRDNDMQEEFVRRVKEKFGIDVDNLRALLDLFVQYAPQLLKIVADIIAMFH